MNRKFEFEHAGRKLEIRVISNGDQWDLAVFENDTMRNPRAMKIPKEMLEDSNVQGGLDLINQICLAIEEEVKSGRFQVP